MTIQTADEVGPSSSLGRFVSGFFGDVRYAVRVLAKARGFTFITLITLALCIGANTAIFSLVYALMLKPLPFPEPSRIVEIYNTFPKAGLNKMPSNVVQYLDYKRTGTSYETLGLWRTATGMLGEEGSAERIDVGVATWDFFDVLGVKPVIGTLFDPGSTAMGADRQVVLTQAFWETHFHEDPTVVGRSIQMDSIPWKVVGVVPRAFGAFDAQVKLIRAFAWGPEAENPNARFGLSTGLFARLKPGVSVQQAQAEAIAIERRYYDSAAAGQKQFLDRAGHKIRVGGVQVERVAPFKSSLYLLQGGVICVLLIGCVNVANLLLARANGRQSELAIRFTLGASRAVIARQLLVESVLLTVIGAGFGVGLAYGAIHAVNHFSARLLPHMLPFTMDARVLAYTAGLSIAVGFLIGVTPVVHMLRTNLLEIIHRTSRSASSSRGVRAMSSILVTGQIAAALVLLTGAALLIHSFTKALAVNPGFDPNNLITGRVALPAAYREAQRSVTFQVQFAQALKEIPGITDVAFGTGVPFQGGLPINALAIKDSNLPPDSPQPGAYQVGVSVGYFQAMRIQVLDGRVFTDDDTAKPGSKFIVDERFAHRYLSGSSPVGRRFTFGGPPTKDEDWPVIIGVVRNVPHNGIEDKSNVPFVYFPMKEIRPGGMNFFVRTQRAPTEVIALIREKLHVIDPSLPLFDTQTMPAVIASSLDYRRGIMLLLGGFAGLALFLSAIGIYGVLAYDVSQRTREIGIRGAIGATRAQVVGMIMRQGLWKTGVGLAIGVACAILLSHTMESLLFDLAPTDPWAYVAVALLLAAVAALASYVPARQAARIAPLEALRSE